MPVSAAFRAYILEQLNRLAPVTARGMFGGVGLYTAGLFFGLIDDDTLYFKVDDGNRAAFEAAGMQPFRPFGPDTPPMAYFEVPADAIEDPEALRPWLAGALAAARRARAKKGAKSAKATRGVPKAAKPPKSPGTGAPRQSPVTRKTARKLPAAPAARRKRP
jgi:DNA transformation protein